ncbi:hypothetical protein POM88_028801 [Heracleum sosnowskyi]|uniref:Myb/SANT-like domain-containing protein n=1 Tax=Heracleum sosnowskyi TaxID=360622 RepID=A0AAD8HTL1_9APIA|nr:hypothetical protein POM88_028801 [Heracleum sosnowskyi]
MASSTSENKKATSEGRNRRIWTTVEERALVDSYYLLISNGYKLDNSQYINGYVLELEKNIIKILPNTDLRERPHIESKIKTWRKQWGSIYTALATSAIAWNDTQKMLTIEDEDVWKQICKDRAMGEHAEAAADILENLDKEQCETEFSCSTGDSHANE